MTRERRAIRMNDEEWQAFKQYLGPEWLRQQIAKVRRKKDEPAGKIPAMQEAE